MKYFDESEFGGHYGVIAQGQKDALDDFREMWGAPVSVSQHPEAVARWHPTSKSQHNVEVWGQSYATDIFPDGLVSYSDAVRAIQCAKAAGFTGIGIYPEWNQGVGMHVDTRRGSHVATWGQVGGDYVSIKAALEELR